MNNREFFEAYASCCSIGLVGSTYQIDQSIMKAQKKITPGNKPSYFSHAFLIGEKRSDDFWWVIESDLDIHRKSVRLGVQENRIDKYYDDELYPNVAILNFQTDENARKTILREALNLLSGRAPYPLRDIAGIIYSMAVKDGRKKENIFSQENGFVCSSFVQHCYLTAGLLFNENVSAKNVTPQDIYATPLTHIRKEIIRQE